MSERVTIHLAEPGEDAELKAVSYMLSVLENFDSVTRARILTYLHERTQAMKRVDG